MENTVAEDVYYSLLGQMRDGYQIPWVENAFGRGSRCANEYEQMQEAYARLRDRLGVVDEDTDAEIIIDALLDIQRELCPRMFDYGMEYAKKALL